MFGKLKNFLLFDINVLFSNPRIPYVVIIFIIIMGVGNLLFFTNLCKPNSKQETLFFLSGKDFFADSFNPIKLCYEKNFYLAKNADKDLLKERVYPPIGYAPFMIIKKMTEYQSNVSNYKFSYLIQFFTYTVISLLFLFLLYNRLEFGNRLNIPLVMSLLFSNVFLFTWERGNYILLSVLLVSFYLFFYDSKDKFLKELSFISIALASGMKISPAFLGILIILNRDWFGAIRTVIYGIVFFFIPFFFLDGGIKNLLLLITNIKIHIQHYSILPSRCMFENYVFLLASSSGEWLTIIKSINLISLGLGILSSFVALFEKNKVKRIFLFVFALLLLPSVSQIYCYIYLFPCIILFFNNTNDFKYPKILTVLLAVFLIPFQVIVHGANYSFYIRSISIDLFFLMLFYQSCKDNLIKLYCYIPQRKSSLG